MKTSDDYGIRAVERAFDVLKVLGQAAGPRSLPSIAAAAGLSVTTTYRLLRTLQAMYGLKPTGRAAAVEPITSCWKE